VLHDGGTQRREVDGEVRYNAREAKGSTGAIGEVHGIAIELSDVAVGTDGGQSGPSIVRCPRQLNGGASVVKAWTWGWGKPPDECHT
jgi:hypothetical protein